MNYKDMSKKHLNEMEQQVRQLLYTMKRAKLDKPSLIDDLKQLAQELEAVRQGRYDATNSEYHTT